MPKIIGGQEKYSVTPTTAAATASPMYKIGLAFGTVTNPTSVDKTLTWYGGYSSTRTSPLGVIESDAAASTPVTQVAYAGTIADIHPAMAGVPIAYCVTTTAASSVALHFAWFR